MDTITALPGQTRCNRCDEWYSCDSTGQMVPHVRAINGRWVECVAPKCNEHTHQRMRRSIDVHAAHTETHYAQDCLGEIAYLAGRCKDCRSDIALSRAAVALATDESLELYGVHRPDDGDLYALEPLNIEVAA